MHPSHIMTQSEIIRNNLNKSDSEITKDKCDSTHAHRRHLAANGKHENKRNIYCTNVHLRIIEILITLMYKLSAVTAAVTLSCWGVRVCVRAPLVPRHSWLGMCVLGLGVWLRPATPGWGVGVCVFVCALCLYPATPGWGVRCGLVCSGSGFGCAPPLLAGVLAFVCVCVRAPLVPRHSWLGCAACVCVLGLEFWLRPATPGWGVGVCVFVCALRLYPTTPGWVVRCWRVCFGSGFGCAPPLLAGVCRVGVCAWARVSAAPRHSWLGCSGSVCACVRAPLVPRHSWLGCVVWVCALGLGFRLLSATPGWGVGVCVFVCALRLYPATPGCGVRAWARVLAAPRHSWLGCWGVRFCVRAPLVPRHSLLGCAVWVCVLGLGFRLRPATPGLDLWCAGLMLPGTCSGDVDRCVLCSLPGFAAPGGRCCLAPGLTRSRRGPGHGTLRWTRASEQAGKALRSQGHHCAHVM